MISSLTTTTVAAKALFHCVGAATQTTNVISHVQTHTCVQLSECEELVHRQTFDKCCRIQIKTPTNVNECSSQMTRALCNYKLTCSLTHKDTHNELTRMERANARMLFGQLIYNGHKIGHNLHTSFE